MLSPSVAAATPSELQWPAVTRQARPWTRWWWLGSAVDKANLTRLLETYQQAGLGGVEITPIYGVQGQAQRNIPYLSAQWVEMLKHTINEAHRLDMGVDMPTGTGWPFGGPQVSDADAEDKLVIQTQPLVSGQAVEWDVGKSRPQALVAVADEGQRASLLDKINGQGRLAWTPPLGHWTLYTVTQKWAGQRVKRAAPGSAGKCINPFNEQSLHHYLQRFDVALASLPSGALRCHFHDSFEYQANWAANFFAEFQARRGYDLRDHLPAMTGAAAPDEIARVRTDYRATISAMLLENFTYPWTEWAHSKGSLSRNQAHGSPGNLLDLYGAVDIPETEVFRHIGDPRVSKFASSAAHVMGHPLTSSESCTWMSEHFTGTLAQAKIVLDRLMVSGINHIFYHGTAYSPADATWPGWLFYASTHFEPNNTLWHDFPTLNTYVTRCQSILQAGRPDNDVLLYWPLHDVWQKRPHLFGLTIEGKWLEGEPVGVTAQTLWDRGYAYDYVSDHQLSLTLGTPQGIQLPGGHYRTVLAPPCDYMPLDTLQALLRLAENGATVIFQDHLPSDVPGLGDLAQRRQELKALLASLNFMPTQPGIQEAKRDKGHILVGNDLAAMLSIARVQRETLVDHKGLMFIRRAMDMGHAYFLTNQGETALDGWVELAVPAKTVVIMNPMTGQTGIAEARPGAAGGTQVCLQLQPGESTVLRTVSTRGIKGTRWPYVQVKGEPVTLAGMWHAQFIEGGPQLPAPFETRALASWTTLGDTEAQRFAGTARYTLVFDAPHAAAQDWLLDLGQVCESARVRLNEREVGTLIASPFQTRLGPLKQTGNVLEVDVTDVAANRIRDLDRRGVRWKIFDEINFVNIDYKPFDASNWPLHDSGLLGPVRLMPLTNKFNFNHE